MSFNRTLSRTVCPHLMELPVCSFCSVLLGSVPTDKRQSMVDNFNRPSDPRFLFLLSSKAGGVGINL